MAGAPVGGHRPGRALREDDGPRPYRVDEPAAVAQRLHGDPQQVAVRDRGQGERVGGAPRGGGEETPPEELSGLRIELVDMPALYDQADHAVGLRDDGDHAQPVAPHVLQRCDHAEAHDQGQRVGVHERPQHLHQRLSGQVRPGELVDERQRDGHVGQQVHDVPGLVRQPPPRDADGDRHHDEEQRGSRGGGGEPGQSEHGEGRSEQVLVSGRGPAATAAPAWVSTSPRNSRPPAECQRASTSGPTRRSSTGVRAISSIITAAR